jgi:hypothetical protein
MGAEGEASMIIVHGSRWYGQAFERGEQCVKTRCYHLYFLPLIPLSQMWITRRVGDQLVGIPIRWSWSAALSVVGLPWGALLALIIGAAVAPVAAIPVIGLVLVGWIAALRASQTVGRRADAGRDLAATVLRTGCPPELLSDPMAPMIAGDLDQAWAKACPDRSPEDVAALGPRDLGEAALAYTLLAVRARLERGALAATLRERAERVVVALERTPSLPEGAPYRAELKLPDASA